MERSQLLPYHSLYTAPLSGLFAAKQSAQPVLKKINRHEPQFDLIYQGYDARCTRSVTNAGDYWTNECTHSVMHKQSPECPILAVKITVIQINCYR